MVHVAQVKQINSSANMFCFTKRTPRSGKELHQARRNGIGLCRLFSRSKTEERHKEDFVCKDSIYMMTERLTKLFRSALLALWGAFSLFSAANAQKVADSQNATTAAALPHLEI